MARIQTPGEFLRVEREAGRINSKAVGRASHSWMRERKSAIQPLLDILHQ